MRSFSMLVLGCLVMVSAVGANQGCGCGPIKGAYFTASVVSYDDGIGWVEQPGLVAPRTFAMVMPIDSDQYLVAGGFTAERDGAVATYATTTELCSVTSGCVILTETEDPEGPELWGPGSGVGSLADGTKISAVLIVRPDGSGGYVTTPARYRAVLQHGTTVLAQAQDGQVFVFVDGTTPPKLLGQFAATLVAAIDDSHVLLVSGSETVVLDVGSGSAEIAAGPGMSVQRAIALGPDALVLGYDKARRFDAGTKMWRDVASLAGQAWTVELGVRDGAILSQGDPDAEGTVPYRLFRYRAADDSLVPMDPGPGFDYGATWMEMPSGAVMRVGGARSWFDDQATLASA